MRTSKGVTRLLGLLAAALWAFAPTVARAAQVDLRVLVIATGDTSEDQGRALCEQLLSRMGVPYTVLDSSRQQLTDSVLRSGSRGRFNGIILTQSETFLPSGTTGFDAAEFARLHAYERDYGVREAVLSGFPATNPTLGLDYGMASIGAGMDVAGTWQGPAGGTELFEYVNVNNALPTAGFTFLATARNGAGDPVVTPLLVDDNGYGLLFRIQYPDGRDVLLSTLNQAPFFVHSHVLAYEFLNFATSGVFLGARRAYLVLHNDDMFLPDELWDPATLDNFPEDVLNFRLAGWELDVAADRQQTFRAAHPLAPSIVTEIAFNGIGASAGEDLTEAVRENAGQFGFINHTYAARQMDWLCDEDPQASSGSSGGLLGGLFNLFNWWNPQPKYNAYGCRRTDYQAAYDDINANRGVWSQLNLPFYSEGRRVLLTDSHSGLSDRRGTPDTADDIPFPDGFNDDFGRAATALGVSVLAGDASREGQGQIQRVPGHNLAILPRYPTSLFYNTSTPAELVSEYNYIFHYRHVEQGLDPCQIPGAICTPRSYEEILAAEAEVTLRHILQYEPFPHYFHQPNLHVYDEAGHVLQFDWMERVVGEYEKYITLPLQSPRFHQLADVVWRRINTAEAQVSGYLDTTRGTVTLSSRSTMDIEMTGVEGGALYGGQRLTSVRVNRWFPQTFRVDRALNQ